MTAREKRARARLIRRRHRVLKGLPLRRDFGRARPRRGEDAAEERDLDTPNPDLIGFTEEGL